MKKCLVALAAVFLVTQTARAQGGGTLIVSVHGKDGPVALAEVQAGTVTRMTGVDGTVTLSLPPGRVDVVVTRTGFDPGATQVEIRAGMESRIDVALEPASNLEENVIVSATRSEQRIEDVPLRVEVVPSEEVQEKIAMSPGDVSMLLAETNGLRVQTTSPSLGGASLRIQGLSGRYSQVLSDGLPLYGAQSGSVGILQIPPMDLQQVEVIKGVASALYGMSAIGGVVNLVSRRPVTGTPEHELLVNRTSHRGTDAALWLAQPVTDRWGYSVLGGAHWQERSDLDRDGWTDVPMFRRTQVRPRVSWDNGGGRSFFATLGALTEVRRGGSVPGGTMPDGQPHPENLDTRQFDGGFVARFLTSKKVVGAVRGSGVSQRHDRAYGGAIQRDRSGTLFGEASLTGTAGKHTWVGGAALQRDTFRSIDVPRFDYTYTVPGVFAQDDYAIVRWLTASASARVDLHSEFGTFFSPRLSLMFRPSGQWTLRVSGGRGHFAPSPFTDETDATGLAPLAPLGAIEPERASSISTDVTWRSVPFEITTTVFHSSIAGAQVFRQLPDGSFAARIVNAETPTRTSGTEFIARYHTEDVDVIVTHMFMASTEVGEDGTGRRPVPLNPRQSASFDLLLEMGPGRLGFEVFYTGKQTLEDDPYRSTSRPYILWGLLYTHTVGPALLYVNTEDLADVRQTKYDPLLRGTRLRDGRWSTDAWAPLDGRTVNAGLRFRF